MSFVSNDSAVFHETIGLYPPMVQLMSFVSHDSAVCHETIMLYLPIPLVYVVCIQQQRSLSINYRVVSTNSMVYMLFVSNDSAVCHETIVLYPPIV